jgi:hypothetical protein
MLVRLRKIIEPSNLFIRTANHLFESLFILICFATFFRKKWRKKLSAHEKSPENAGTFIEGIELIRLWRIQTAIPS